MPYFLRDLKNLALFYCEQYFPKDRDERKCLQVLFGFCCFKGFYLFLVLFVLFVFFITLEQLFNKRDDFCSEVAVADLVCLKRL